MAESTPFPPFLWTPQNLRGRKWRMRVYTMGMVVALWCVGGVRRGGRLGDYRYDGGDDKEVEIDPYEKDQANPLAEWKALTGGKESRAESWTRLREDPIFEMKKAELDFQRLMVRNPVRAMLLQAEAAGKTITLTPELRARLERDDRIMAKRSLTETKLKNLGLGAMLDGTNSEFVGKSMPRLPKFREMISEAQDHFVKENTMLGYATPGRTAFEKPKKADKLKEKHKPRHKKHSSHSSKRRDKDRERSKTKHHRRREHSSKEESEKRVNFQGDVPNNKKSLVNVTLNEIRAKQWNEKTRNMVGSKSVVDNFGELVTQKKGKYPCGVDGCTFTNDDWVLTKMHEEGHTKIQEALDMPSDEAAKELKKEIADSLGIEVDELDDKNVFDEWRKMFGKDFLDYDLDGVLKYQRREYKPDEVDDEIKKDPILWGHRNSDIRRIE